MIGTEEGVKMGNRNLKREEVLPSLFSEGYHSSRADDPCVCCGRNVGKRGYSIIVAGGGVEIIHPDDAEAAAATDNGFMGAYNVGSECIKRVPAEYRIRRGA